MTTPESTAETWLGATGCAIGSQTWSGISPALVPKPTSARRKTRLRVPSVSPAEGIATNEPNRAPGDTHAASPALTAALRDPAPRQMARAVAADAQARRASG